MIGQNTIVMPNAAIIPQSSSAVIIPDIMKKQNVANAGFKNPLNESFRLLDESLLCPFMCLFCQFFIAGDLDLIELVLLDFFDMVVLLSFLNYKINPGSSTVCRVTPKEGITPETVERIA